jgi:hypothetical protein
MKKLILLLFISTIIIGCTDKEDEINPKYDWEVTRTHTQYFTDGTDTAYVYIEETLYNLTLEEAETIRYDKVETYNETVKMTINGRTVYSKYYIITYKFKQLPKNNKKK